MKTFKFSYLLLLAGLIAALLLVSSCSDSSTGPDIDDTTQIEDDGPGDPIDPPQADNFKIISDDVTETDDGYRFDGVLVGINEEGIEFELGEGEFSVVLDENGVIISITGIGLPEFPNVGIYKEILEDFAWDKIESHILYKKGSAFLEEFDTEVPLNPDRYYVTYRVFDESNDGEFGLRGIGNSIIHNFNEIYIDIDDPAIFLKFQLWKPKAKDASKAADKFWKKALENAKFLGQNFNDYTGAPNMILGISNTGTFLTPEYEPGIKDSQVFENLYGFKGLESKAANLFMGVSGVPIPKTLILRLNGHVYVNSPLIESVDGSGNIESALDWLNQFEEAPYRQSYSGNIDFGGKGIGLILTGLLPHVNDILDRDIFNNDIELSLADGFYQEEFLSDGTSSFKIGGGFQKPLIADIFGPNIQQYLISQPDANGYLYLDVGTDPDESSLFVEQAQRIIIPAYGEVDLSESHFLINRDGFNFYARTGFNIGPIELNRELTGQFSGDGYLISSIFERDITLENGVVLGNREMELTLSSNSGATLSGTLQLPANLKTVSVNGSITQNSMSLTGSMMSSSLTFHGANFPISNSSVTASTDSGVEAAFRIRLNNNLNVNVSGSINQSGYSFTGSNNFSRSISSGSLSGTITTRLTQDGITLTGTGRVVGLLGNELWSGSLSIHPNWSNGTIRVCTTGSYDVCVNI